MRAFIAVELPPQFRDEAASVARQLGATIDARYTPRENYHVTLAFLGDIDEGELRRAISALERVTADASSLALIPDGIGKFGRASNATLWLGLAKTSELMKLAHNLHETLRDEGVDFDDSNDFLPHITLARRANILHAELPQLLFPQEALAVKVTIFKSTLERSGAIYKPLYTVELAQPE